MLIVRRRAGERLIIGEGIEIEILESRANGVKLGIIAPPSVTIVRGESMLTRSSNLNAAQSMGAATIATVLNGLLQHAPSNRPVDILSNGYQKTLGETLDGSPSELDMAIEG